MTISFHWEKIQEKRPLVHQITNYVTVNDCANITLATGASPVMAHAIEEVEEMAKISQALVLNIGTLDPATLKAMIKAGQSADHEYVPIVLDPVGAGATAFRIDSLRTLLREVSFTVIRGNASEILTLCGIRGGKGVDATSNLTEEQFEAIRQLAIDLKTTIAVSGPVDFITDGSKEAHVNNGTPLLTKITGTGCMTTALIGCCLGAEIPPFESAVTALTAMGIVGEWAERMTGGDIGQFHQCLFDGFGRMNSQWLENEGKVHVPSA